MAELEIIPEALTETEPNREDDLTRISSLLAGDSPEPAADAGDDDPPAADDPPAPLETGGAEPEPDADDEPPEPIKIDYDQAIPMPDGQETVTIGQLKDHYQAKTDFETERDSWESHRMSQDNELVSARRELQDLAQMVGDVKPELLQHLNQQRNARRTQQKELLLGIYPEWADPAVKKAASVQLIATAKEMGYSELEFQHIDDHRHIKVLHHLSKYMARDKAGQERREQLKAELPKGRKSVQRKPTKAQERAAKIKRAQNGSEADKLGAIGALIDGA